ncbi:hypothetical protein NJBCHELONAE_41050 [Mycobacteroides chelonae]|nr:hypothetical protein NJBCHELONAE_41050 [Mycobacteroides chelonae]
MLAEDAGDRGYAESELAEDLERHAGRVRYVNLKDVGGMVPRPDSPGICCELFACSLCTTELIKKER